MSAFQTLDDFDPAGKRVLLRCDLNVPMSEGKVTDGTRLERLVPTISALTERGARVLLASHFGRPKGQVVGEMSLEPVARELASILNREVAFAPDCIGDAAMEAAAALQDGEILVLENLRFHTGEEANDPAFVKSLAGLADVYVNDAFSVSHRAHASTEGVAHVLPSYAGRLMQAELDALERAGGARASGDGCRGRCEDRVQA